MVELSNFTDVSNHVIAESAIREFYINAGLSPPKEMMWVDSPYKCLKFWKMCKEANVDDLGKPVKDELNRGLSPFTFITRHMRKRSRIENISILSQVKERLKEEVGINVINNSFYGIFSDMPPFLLSIRNNMKSVDDQRVADMLLTVYSETAWMIPYENVCVISEKPLKFHINERVEFSHEEERALEFKDGFGIYSINGVTIPDFIIEDASKITAKLIKKEQNLEIRRIMIDRMGISKYLDEVRAKVLDMDMIYVFKAGDDRTMPRALMLDDEGNKYLVGTDGSTERVYYMRVPPMVMTCKEAHSVIAGFDESVIIANS